MPLIKILAVFFGWVALLMTGVALARHARPVVAGFALAGVLLAIYAVSRSYLVPYSAVGEQRCVLLTGDEPDYLLTALSLARDGDINVNNNIEQADYRLFQDRPVGGGDFDFFNRISKGRITSHRAEWGNARYMQHRPGISVVVAPVFMIARGNFRWWAYTLISSILVLFAVLGWRMSDRFGVDRGLAWAACLGCVLTPPVLFYANQVYPEVVAGCLLAGAATLIMAEGKFTPWAIPALMAVVWFSDRALPAFAALAVAAVGGTGSWRPRLAGMAALSASLVFFALYCQHRFGIPIPITHSEVFDCSVKLVPRRMFQILLDGRQGWVWLFPPALLFPAVLWTLIRQRPRPVVPLLIAASLLLNLAMVASFGDWRGGTNPRGRYYVIPQLILLPLLFHWFRAEDAAVRRTRAAWFIGLVALALVPLPWLLGSPSWWYRLYHPFFGWEPIQRYYAWLPSLPDEAGVREWLKGLAWLPLLAIPSAVCIWRQERCLRLAR